jgi:tetratricopeptide (TPR) repeat protein
VAGKHWHDVMTRVPILFFAAYEVDSLPPGRNHRRSRVGHSYGQEKPVALYEGLGAWHHAISTSNPDAQKFFDQGLTLAFSFNRYEALRSFQRASRLDPSAVMPFWGMAFAQGPYINMDGDPSFNNKAACAAVETGSKLKNAPDAEKDYLKVAASWCPEFRPYVYLDAARQLAAKYPDDLDAQTLYADSLLVRTRWRWYDRNDSPAGGVSEAETVLQNVIRRWPQHPGANHLYIHAVESSPTPERGIASAQRMMGIVPWAGHMVHMPAHIWLVLGDWETAAVVNERAVSVDREYFMLTKVSEGTYVPYYLHNLHFIAYARSMQGRKAQALKAADELTLASSEMGAAMPEMADGFSAMRMFVYARFKAWNKILSNPSPRSRDGRHNCVRFHFGEIAISVVFRAAQVVVIGLTPTIRACWQVFLFLCILFHHSNVRFPLAWERRLARVLITPRLHGIHHYIRPDEVNSNWSSGLSCWDLLHATLRTEPPQDT